jgi:Cys-rich protein (TIGR01571 family)
MMCCSAFFCPCVLFGEIVQELDHQFVWGKSYCGSCCAFFGCGLLECTVGSAVGATCCSSAFSGLAVPFTMCVHLPLRQKIREKYGINAKDPKWMGWAEDIVVTWLCCCCALVQEYEQVRKFKKDSNQKAHNVPLLPNSMNRLMRL